MRRPTSLLLAWPVLLLAASAQAAEPGPDRLRLFKPPARPPLLPTPPSPPPGKRGINGGWVRNPFDAFVLARLEAKRLRPSPQADKLRLLRRLTFDLTGLPPTVEEQHAFLADTRPGAYERLV